MRAGYSGCALRNALECEAVSDAVDVFIWLAGCNCGQGKNVRDDCGVRLLHLVSRGGVNT